MQYVELVDKIEATAEGLKNRLRALELSMFNEDKEQLRQDKIIVARIKLDNDLDNDDVSFVSFSAHTPLLPVDLSSTHMLLVKDGDTLYRLKTSMKIIELFFASSVDELPYKPITKHFMWHRFEINFTPLRKRSKIVNLLQDNILKEFSFLDDKERDFLHQLTDVMEHCICDVSARDIVACIDKPLDYEKYKDDRRISLGEQIVEMYKAKHR